MMNTNGGLQGGFPGSGRIGQEQIPQPMQTVVAIPIGTSYWEKLSRQTQIAILDELGILKKEST